MTSDRLGFYNDDLERCPECGEILEEEWENVGFTAPDPEKWIVTRIYCPECGWEEEI